MGFFDKKKLFDNVLVFEVFFFLFGVMILGDEQVQGWPREEAVEGEADFRG